jgi:lycopene beta-cyclase
VDRYQYLIVLGLCVAITLPLELVIGARVWRRPLRTLRAIGPPAAVFLVWDVLAHRAGHWWFTDAYTTEVRILGLPLAEWLFFLVIPLCGLLTYEAVSIMRGERGDGAGWARGLTARRTRTGTGPAGGGSARTSGDR